MIICFCKCGIIFTFTFHGRHWTCLTVMILYKNKDLSDLGVRMENYLKGIKLEKGRKQHHQEGKGKEEHQKKSAHHLEKKQIRKRKTRKLRKNLLTEAILLTPMSLRRQLQIGKGKKPD